MSNSSCAGRAAETVLLLLLMSTVPMTDKVGDEQTMLLGLGLGLQRTFPGASSGLALLSQSVSTRGGLYVW